MDPLPRRRPPWALAAVPAITLAITLWGAAAPAYWGDEADTVSAVSRSLPQLLWMLRHTDAVHGLYYVLLWPVTRVLGTGEFATRLPSAVAMAAAALGVAAIARRLASPRAGLCAGLVFAALPMVSAQAHNARPYGMVTAAAVLASYLLLRAVADPRPRWFAWYAVSLAVLGYLELFGLLLVLAHGITLAGLRRGGGLPRDGRLVRRWRVSAALGIAAVLPVVGFGWLQRAEIAWIAAPGWRDVVSLPTSLAAVPVAAAVVLGLLAVLGGRSGGAPGVSRPKEPGRPEGPWLTWPGRPAGVTRLIGPARPAGVTRLMGPGRPAGPRLGQLGRRLTWLALPWLVAPPALLLAASRIEPVYNGRYVVFCLPALALLAGGGLAALGRVSRAAALGLIVALVVPSQLSMRAPGTGMRAASRLLAARERPGDAVIYPGTGIPPWYLAYPDGLGRLRDISMAASGPATGRLYGLRVPLPVLLQRERGVCRIWAVEVAPPWQDPAGYLLPGFGLAGAWQPAPGVRMWLYQRPGCGGPPGAAR